ncbi:MAG: RNA methyltransferase [Gammaproteobacteria bacterium]|nr:RNA methyltransferase [Gammaproteobacteria bacterium]MCP5199356.1 RNA methyltransferase [Gammaproteobacteria bacterium]
MRIVLVATTHPGNIGAAARAMKAMGLSSLHLVRPAHFPSAEATARAAGADDLLAAASVHDDLAAALAGCNLVIGTTARERHLDWPSTDPREAAALVATTTGEVALVFGRERSGLSNEELDQCQRAVYIPTSPGYRSLNLAQAVQVLAYEVRLALLDGAATTAQPRRGRLDPPASAAEIAALEAHCLRVMAAVGYYDAARPKLLARRVKRLLARPGLLHSEYQILRGFLAAVEAGLGADGGVPSSDD